MSSACKTGKPKYTARIDNIYFLSRIGVSLRWATRGMARCDLPADIRQLLTRLDRQEARDRAKERTPGEGPA
jgi:hypothetical protein